ncbi:MAG: hypothetical protein AB7F19_04855 [Candidatus Babeliales bacterium]
MKLQRITSCFFLLILVLYARDQYAQTSTVNTIIINNESGMDITVLLNYEDNTSVTQFVMKGEKKTFYAQDQCLYGISLYSERWRNVTDIDFDDKLIIPVTWNRCQGWIFTIKKRSDGTVHIARKQSVRAQREQQTKAGT